jgi:hypothetical protein
MQGNIWGMGVAVFLGAVRALSFVIELSSKLSTTCFCAML